MPRAEAKTKATKKKPVREPLPIIPYQSRVVPMRSSAWETLKECPRKFLFAERFGLKDKKRYDAALFIGDIAHIMVTGQYKGLSEEQVELEAATKMGEQITRTPDKRKVIEQDFAMGKMMANVYFDYFPMDMSRFTIVKDLIEVLLTYDHPAYVAPLMGRLDTVLKDKDGAYWIWDLKTLSGSIPTTQRAATFLFDPQPWFYRILLQKELDRRKEDAKVAGVFHVIIQKPTLRLKQVEATDEDGVVLKDPDGKKIKRPETFKEYCQRCVLDFYDQRLEQSKQSPDMHPPVLVSQVKFPKRTPNWVNVMMGELDKACSGTDDPAYHYPSKSACFNYNSRCPFLQVCQASENTWPAILGTHFEQRFREDEERGERIDDTR